jgi:hypothetical protein
MISNCALRSPLARLFEERFTDSLQFAKLSLLHPRFANLDAAQPDFRQRMIQSKPKAKFIVVNIKTFNAHLHARTKPRWHIHCPGTPLT